MAATSIHQSPVRRALGVALSAQTLFPRMYVSYAAFFVAICILSSFDDIDTPGVIMVLAAILCGLCYPLSLQIPLMSRRQGVVDIFSVLLWGFVLGGTVQTHYSCVHAFHWMLIGLEIVSTIAALWIYIRTECGFDDFR